MVSRRFDWLCPLLEWYWGCCSYFFLCMVAREVRNRAHIQWIILNSEVDFWSSFRWSGAQSPITYKSKKECVMPLAILWAIWLQRNDTTFNNNRCYIENIFSANWRMEMKWRDISWSLSLFFLFFFSASWTLFNPLCFLSLLHLQLMEGWLAILAKHAFSLSKTKIVQSQKTIYLWLYQNPTSFVFSFLWRAENITNNSGILTSWMSPISS